MTPPYAPPRRPWRTKLRESVTERLGLKLIALLLSVLLWLVVRARRPAEGDVADRGEPRPDAPRSAPGLRAAPAGAPAPATDSTVVTSP